MLRGLLERRGAGRTALRGVLPRDGLREVALLDGRRLDGAGWTRLGVALRRVGRFTVGGRVNREPSVRRVSPDRAAGVRPRVPRGVYIPAEDRDGRRSGSRAADGRPVRRGAVPTAKRLVGVRLLKPKHPSRVPRLVGSDPRRKASTNPVDRRMCGRVPMRVVRPRVNGVKRR